MRLKFYILRRLSFFVVLTLLMPIFAHSQVYVGSSHFRNPDSEKFLKSIENPSAYAEAFLLGINHFSKVNKTALPSARRSGQIHHMKLLEQKILEKVLAHYRELHVSLEMFLSQKMIIPLIPEMDQRLSTLSGYAHQLSIYREKVFETQNRNNLEEALFSDPEYMQLFNKYKSCEISYFSSPGILGSIANLEIPQMKSYLREKNRESLIPKLPRLSPIQNRIYKTESHITHNSVSFVEYEIQSLRNKYLFHLNGILKKLEVEIQSKQNRLKTLKSDISKLLGGPSKVRPLFRVYKVQQETLQTLVSHPFEFALVIGEFEFSHLNPVLLFKKSHDYFQSQKNLLGNQLFLTGGLALGSIFLPGGILFAGLSTTVRVATVAYLAISAVQAGVIANYINNFYGLNQSARAIDFFNDPTGFTDYSVDQIRDRLWEGGLAMAFIGMGEVAGVAKLGQGFFTNELTQFFRWGRRIGSKLVHRKIMPSIKDADQAAAAAKDLTNDAKNIKERFDQFSIQVNAASKSLHLMRQFDYGSFQRAKVLVEWLQDNQQFQSQFNKMIAEFSSDREKRLFLDAAIEIIFRDASIAAELIATKPEFLKTLTSSLEELVTLSSNSQKFYQNAIGYVTRAETHTGNLIDQLNKEIIEKTSDLRNFNGTPIEKLKALVALKTYLQTLKIRIAGIKNTAKIQKSTRQSFPFLNENADKVKDTALRLLDEALKDEQIARNYLQIPQLPEYAGYSIWQGKFYMQKSIVLAELIGEEIARLGAQGAVMSHRLKLRIIESLARINKAPVSKLVTVLELNGFLSRMALKLNLQSENDLSNLSQYEVSSNAIDCSL